ncbi:MAG: hypothetical protein AAGF67_04685 [Verrucomicrobiota bacterium]
MKYAHLFLFVALISPSILSAGEPVFTDPFEAETKVSERRAVRGDWLIENGVASVTQDDELYKKYKDHGPIIFYDVATTDATFHYAVKPQGCKSVVFTLNGENGHIFRFVSAAQGTHFRAFPPGGEKKSIATGREKSWILPEGEWTPIKVVLAGPRATITFGDHEPVIIEEPSYERPKTNFSIGFAFGSLAIKEVRVTNQ